MTFSQRLKNGLNLAVEGGFCSCSKLDKKRLFLLVEAVKNACFDVAPIDEAHRRFHREKADILAFFARGDAAAHRPADEQHVADAGTDILKNAAEANQLDFEAGFLLHFTDGRKPDGFTLFHLSARHFPAAFRVFDQENFIVIVEHQHIRGQDVFGRGHGDHLARDGLLPKAKVVLNESSYVFLST
jgi:hypothetical protein